jgi:putative phosphoserine phosphatase/1-acylglycerol-3-phosphate O-acyltransferase
VPDVDGLLAEIETSPEGPHIAAFFDFDGTLIDGYSAVAYFRDRLMARDVGTQELLKSVAESVNVEMRGRDVHRLVEIAVGALGGRTVDDVNKMGERLFRKSIAQMIFPEARLLVEAHKRRGHTVVMASSALTFQTTAAARDLDIADVLCTRLESRDGVLTGMVDGPILWGEAKASAVREFAAERGIDLAQSFAYGNGTEDLIYLATVGRPRPLNPTDELAAAAVERGWPMARLSRPQHLSPELVVRSAAAYAGAAAGLVAGLALGAVNRDRSTAIGVTASVGSELALAAAGVEMDVVGAENLWIARPAVFIFNHQSQLDVIILAALLREDFTGVAKKELKNDPVFAPLGWLADVAFVDRTNTEEAKKALEPAVKALREGRSLAMAPEGTRSATPRLGPFKKGAFHVAMQAGVPIVPIVIRNAGELMPSHGVLISSGRLDVAVLPPIPTDDWTREDISPEVERVRQMFLDTLADFPR